MADRELLEILLEEMKGIKDSLSGMDGRMSNMEDKMSNMEDKMSNMEDKMSSMEDKMSSMETDVSDLKTNIENVQTLATKTQILLENDVAKKIGALFDGYHLHNQKLDHIFHKIEDVQGSILANEIVTKNNVREIHELKRKA